MPKFKLTLDDGRTIVAEADTQDEALEAAQTWAAQTPTKPKAPAKRTLTQNVTGALANINSQIPLGDELAAAGDTVANLFTGKADARDIPGAFKDSMSRQRGYEADFNQAHPLTAAGMRGVGMIAPAAVPLGQGNLFAQGSRVGNMARGATAALGTGAAYAAADKGTAGERVAAASKAAMNPITATLGAAAGAIAPASSFAGEKADQFIGDVVNAGKGALSRLAPPKPPSRTQEYAKTLADIGVSTTIPQRMGRAAKGAEDIGQRFPILGQAMAGSRDRVIEQLNRGVALKAVKPIGMGVPKEIKPGFEMVEYVDDALGKVYDDAARMVPVVPPQEVQAFRGELEKIAARKVDLADSEAALFDRSIGDRLNRLSNQNVSGETIKKMHEELGALQAEQARRGNTTLAQMFGDARRALMGIVERASPEAGALVKKADEGWGIYSVMNDAAAAATARGGVFLPGQLNTQVRGSARRLGSNMAGKGKGPLQDVATAAASLLPDTYGNPGSANAGLAASGIWGAMTAPGPTAAAATGLTAAATPYFLMARKVLEQLPDNASPEQARKAAQALAELATKDPAVRRLQQELAGRLSIAAGSSSRPGSAVSVEVVGRPDIPVGYSSENLFARP